MSNPYLTLLDDLRVCELDCVFEAARSRVGSDPLERA